MKPRVWCPAAQRRRSNKAACPRWSPPRTENKPHRVTLPPLEGEQSHPYEISTKNSPATMTPPVQTVCGCPPSTQYPARSHQHSPPRHQSADSYHRPCGLRPGLERLGSATEQASRRRDEQGGAETDKEQATEISRSASMAARFRNSHDPEGTQECPGTFSRSAGVDERKSP